MWSVLGALVVGCSPHGQQVHNRLCQRAPMGPAWAGCPGWEEGFPGQGSQTQVKIRASRHDVRSAGVRRGVGRRGPRTLPSQDPSLSHPSVPKQPPSERGCLRSHQRWHFGKPSPAEPTPGCLVAEDVVMTLFSQVKGRTGGLRWEGQGKLMCIECLLHQGHLRGVISLIPQSPRAVW